MHKNIFLFLIFFLYFWKFWRKPGILIPDSYFLEMKKKKQTEIKQNSVKQYTRGNYKYWKIFFFFNCFLKWARPGPNAWAGPNPAQLRVFSSIFFFFLSLGFSFFLPPSFFFRLCVSFFPLFFPRAKWMNWGF